MKNFKMPYFSRDLVEFWQRWHISLSTWFRDYVYISLGGNRVSGAQTYRNIFIVFLLSGFWHGANWTFLVWGVIHALLYLGSRAFFRSSTTNHKGSQQNNYTAVDTVRMVITFGLVTFAWIFFRASSVSDAFQYLHRIFIETYVPHPGQILLLPKQFFLHQCFPFIGGLVLLEWFSKSQDCFVDIIKRLPIRPLRWACYLLLAYSVLWFSGAPSEFIYFAF